MLALQVVLTRFFALAQGHHFAFMTISLALLGAGGERNLSIDMAADDRHLASSPTARGDLILYFTSHCLFGHKLSSL